MAQNVGLIQKGAGLKQKKAPELLRLGGFLLVFCVELQCCFFNVNLGYQRIYLGNFKQYPRFSIFHH